MSLRPVEGAASTLSGAHKWWMVRRMASRRPRPLWEKVFRAAVGWKPASGQQTTQTVSLLGFWYAVFWLSPQLWVLLITWGHAKDIQCAPYHAVLVLPCSQWALCRLGTLDSRPAYPRLSSPGTPQQPHQALLSVDMTALLRIPQSRFFWGHRFFGRYLFLKCFFVTMLYFQVTRKVIFLQSTLSLIMSCSASKDVIFGTL